ncbi:MAG: acyltransferase [candidate division Zixibacteria bacterium]|nr:acyltransferase [candidate division Zixibacteria bacterium]
MLRIFKLLLKDLSYQAGRFSWVQALFKDFPGQAGIEIRRRLYAVFIGRAGEDLTIHQDLRVRNIQNLYVGNRVRLGEGCFIQAGGGVEMGDDVILGPGVKIWSQNHEFSDPYKPIDEQGYCFKKVSIGSNVWIGANSFVMPGAEIGDGVIISAGSVVGAKPIAAYKIVAGNPARIIGSRMDVKEKIKV